MLHPETKQWNNTIHLFVCQWLYLHLYYHVHELICSGRSRHVAG